MEKNLNIFKTSKNKSIIFKGSYITQKINEKNLIEQLHAKHMLALMKFNFFWVLWIIIAIEACVAIDISKKIK